MIGLRTSRILVIDDNPLEALPVIYALGRYGIGAIYVRGDKREELPKKKLTGIRLIFLDMKLSVEGEDKEIVSKTVNVLKSVIDEHASPSVIVLWTKHDDLVKAFKVMLDKAMPNLRPGIILQIQKPFDYEDTVLPRGILRQSGAIKRVERAIRAHPPLDLLWYWEQCMHDATSETTGALAQLAPSVNVLQDGQANAIDDTDSQRWLTSVQYLLGAIVNGIGGVTIIDSPSSLRAAFEGMSPLISDRITHVSHQSRAILRSAQAIADQAGAERVKNHASGSFLSREQRGRLNKMVLLAPSYKVTRLSHMPGNIYFERDWLNLDAAPFPIGKKGLGRSALIAEAVKLPDPRTQNAGQAAIAQKRRKAILRKCHPFLLEFTPPCDYAQQNAKTARLLAGIMVPAENEVRKGQYLKILGPIHLQESDGLAPAGSVQLVLNARYVFGISNSHIGKQKAACRLRAEPLSDVCSWFAGHAARPGYFCLY